MVKLPKLCPEQATAACVVGPGGPQRLGERVECRAESSEPMACDKLSGQTRDGLEGGQAEKAKSSSH